MRRFPLLPLAVASLVAIAVAGIGSMATDTGAWYQQLEQPPLQPPDSVFGPVWTVLYAMIVVSSVIAWRNASTGTERRNVVLLYGLNAVLNLGWTLLFFGARLPLVALIEIVVLWLQIMLLIYYVRRLSGWAAVLLIPYLLWVTFAAYLNLEIVRRNPEETRIAVSSPLSIAAAQPRAASLDSAARSSSAAASPLCASIAPRTARSASPLA
jgi:translocator protein